MTDQATLPKHSVRLSAALVAGVFLVGAIQTLVVSATEGAYILEGAGAVFLSLAVTFALQSVVAYCGCFAVWKVGRTRAHWSVTDYALAVVPWCVWALLVMLAPPAKSFVNVLLEGVVVGCAAPLAALSKIPLARVMSRAASTALSGVLGASIAFALWRFVPFIGE